MADASSVRKRVLGYYSASYAWSELERDLVDRLAETEISLPLQATASEAWLMTSDEGGYWRKIASILFRTRTQHQSTTR
jgi:hypothetical protein